MANWTPESWVGAQFELQARYLPPPPGILTPAVWGTRERLEELFAGRICDPRTSTQHADFVHQSTTSLFALFNTATDGTCEIPSPYLQVVASTPV